MRAPERTAGGAIVPPPALQVQDLRCEYKVDPLGIDATRPRLSWRIESTGRAVLQSAFQIRAAGSREDLAGERLLWDSGRVESGQSTHVEYAGPDLHSRQRIAWQVRVWDQRGNASPWSRPASWEMGLLSASDWTARWIEPDLKEDPKASNPCPMLRKAFVLKAPVRSARAYVTCHGLYAMEINGRPVGDQVFTPGWTAYDKRLQVQTYDVTGLVRAGGNAVGVILGDGWFRGRLMGGPGRNLYGNTLALLAQIEVTYEDGTQDVVVTDTPWKAATGPILASDIYDGEIYDARLERQGWTGPGFDDSAWSGVKVAGHSKDVLVAPAGPPVRRIEEIRPVQVLKTPAGQTVVDMGQNMVGWVRIRVQGQAGRVVTLRHFEVLDKAGNVYLANLRSAKQTVQYTLKGSDRPEVFEPRFTFQGFRYVEVEGWPGPVEADDLTGVVIHSDITPTGTFECSNPMLNQLQRNIVWGQKGNFLDVPTDCPQRNERLGWTGDAQVFARTACFNADVAGFYTKWLADLAADQKANGAVPHVIPDVLSRGQATGGASAGWADAAVVVPWTVYLHYGDRRILERQYPSMKAWVDYMTKRAGETGLWNQDFTYGDWLAFATNRSDYPGATTDKDLICQAYFARSTDLVRRAASVLGRTEDARRYADLSNRVKAVFQREFVTANGRLVSNTQTAYALALAFDLLPDSQRAAAARRLAQDVDRFKHITTGFLGTPVICQVLSDYGYLDQAYLLLNRKDYPSWLYPITRGATTMWERWDGIKSDGSFQDEGMNSFNHYAYGAIGQWLYGVVAGIDLDPEQPGYRHVLIRPQPGGDLSFARAGLDTMLGTIRSAWQIEAGRMRIDVAIPPNAAATVWLPHAQGQAVTEAGQPLSQAEGVASTAQEGQAVVVQVGSGGYRFEYPWGGQ
ncbi:MAG: glycoside hydrolase family 78 protein [Phycisphaerae bacterium]|nr:glycoside hydrolase family 78 protein [Phycisphaerae bacterium]